MFTTMYGDTVNALCYTAFLPVYTYLWWTETTEAKFGAGVITLAFLWTAIFCWTSVVSHKQTATTLRENWLPITCSVLGFVGMMASIAGMNLYQWPHSGQVVLIPQYLWSLLVLSANNYSPAAYCALSLKVGLALYSLLVVVSIAQYSSLVSVTQVLPVLLTSTSVYVCLHYMTSRENAKILKESAPLMTRSLSEQSNADESFEDGVREKKRMVLVDMSEVDTTEIHNQQHQQSISSSTQQQSVLISAHAASLLLAGSFAYHTTAELVRMYQEHDYATEGGYSILRAGFFAAVGLAAAGSFRRETTHKERLQELVKQRTQQIMAQAQHLRMVEHALKASETAMAITSDCQGCIVWCNAALEKLTDQSTSELVGQKLGDALISHDEDGVNMLKGALLRHVNAQFEIQVRNEYIQVEVSPIPLQQHSAVSSTVSKARFLVVMKNITEQKAREKAEQAAAREALVATTMNESMQTLSHELRTPLQGIMGMASLLQKDIESGSTDVNYKSIQESMSVILASAGLLLTLINNMLDVRKSDAQLLGDFTLGPVSLSDTLTDSISFCQPFALTSDVKLQIRYNTTNRGSCMTKVNTIGWAVQSNTLRLQQIMINLISNAIKNSPSSSVVNVSARLANYAEVCSEMQSAIAVAPYESGADDGAGTLPLSNESDVVVISVCDDGPGIRPEDYSQLFGKFAQLHSSVPRKQSMTGQPKGTGLGLNLCAKFVSRMNGRIWAADKCKSKGACFRFYLPLVPHERLSVRSPLSNTSTQKQSLIPNDSNSLRSSLQYRTASQLSILIVDDTVINLKVLSRMLNRLGVKRIRAMSNPTEVFRELQTNHYDILLTDLQMPGLSGQELVKLITDATDLDHKPIMVGLTAQIDESLDTECRKAGMVSVLHKPMTVEQLYSFFDYMCPQTSCTTANKKASVILDSAIYQTMSTTRHLVR